MLLAALAVCEASASQQASAHDPGLSSTIASVVPSGIEVEMRFNDADLTAGMLAPGEGSTTGIAGLGVYPPAGVVLGALAGARPAELASTDLVRVFAGARELAPTFVKRERIDAGHSVVRMFFPLRGAPSLSVSVPLLTRLPFGHKHYLEVRRPDRVVAARVLSAGSAAVAAHLETTAVATEALADAATQDFARSSGGENKRSGDRAFEGYGAAVFFAVLGIAYVAERTRVRAHVRRHSRAACGAK